MSELFLDRTPPQNVEAEQAVLGSVIIERDALTTVSERLSPEDFYRPAHQKIYEAITQLNESGEPVDLVTLTAWLQKKKWLEDVGGVTYIANLASSVPSAANVEYYASLVEEKSLLRRLIRAATQIATSGYAGDEEASELIGDAEKRILEISQRQGKGAFIPIKDVLMETFERIEFLHNHKGGITGIPTGYGDLDKMTSGLQRSDLIILAARPSVGKTAFALNLAQNVAARAGKTVAIFSLEMAASQLVQRMICAEANLDANKMRTGMFHDEDWRKLTMAISTLSQAPIYIDDTAGITVTDIRSKCRRLKIEHGLGLIVIDYLQLIHGRGKENRQQEISEISRMLKMIARELDVPVI
ncbi:MAG: replicative DNA helicase, partial [Bacilli bacterium]